MYFHSSNITEAKLRLFTQHAQISVNQFPSINLYKGVKENLIT